MRKIIAFVTIASLPLLLGASGSLRIDPPRMLYWGTIFRSNPDRYICEVLRTSEIVEADETQMARAKALPCGKAYGGDWLRYTVLFTWNCPLQAESCPFWKNHIYGNVEPVPDEALLHHIHAGNVSCKTRKGVEKTISWASGDPWDLLHVVKDGKPWLCGRYGERPIGTHLLVNPSNSWTRVAVKRYARARLVQGYSWARIDEVQWADALDWWDVAEYQGGTPEKNFAKFVTDQANMIKGMRDVDGWKATCPSQHKFWGDREMKLNRAGGCVASENFPYGGGIAPNVSRRTISSLRATYGHRLQNAEAWDSSSANDSSVPGNVFVAKRYESTQRNVEGAAMMVMQARINDSPNLYWLLDCGDTAGIYGAALQEAVASGDDRVMCIGHWGRFRDRETGRLPPWFMPQNHEPTWSEP